MPAPLGEEEKQEIRDTYAETGSIEKTAKELGYAKDTVQKYTDDMRDDNSPQFVTSEPSENLSDLGYGEFINHFFEEYEIVSVKDDFVNMVANMAEARGEIPDEDQMKYMIENNNSGISNAHDAALLAETYWKVAESYIAANRSQQQPVTQNGQWQSAQAVQGMQNGPSSSGGWTDPNQPQQQQRGQMGAQQMQGPTQLGQMMQQMMQQQQQMMKQFMEQQQQQQQTMQESIAEAMSEMSERIEQVDEDAGSDSFIEQIKELQQAQNMLENLMGGGGGDEQTQQLISQLYGEIDQLKQELEESDNSSELDPAMLMQSDSNMALLATMAQKDDMEATQLAQVAEKLGQVESDPNVAEKKLEKQMKELEMKKEQEKWDKILSGVEDSLGNILGVLSQGVSGSGTDEAVRERPIREDEVRQEAEPEVVEERPDERVEEHPDNVDRSPAQDMLEEAGETEVSEETEESLENVVDGLEEVDEVEEPVEESEDDPDIEEADKQTETQQPEEESGDTDMTDNEGIDVVESTQAQQQVQSEPLPDEQDQEQEEYVCEVCGESFDTEMGLRGHMSSH